jgi:hypothetical protein
MAYTQKLYGAFPVNMGGGDASGDGPMDLLSDTIKGMLTDATDTIVQGTDEVKANVSGEIAGTGGYTAGGFTLASKTYVWSSLVSTFDAADTTYAASTITASRCHYYDDTVATPAKPLICYQDFGGAQTTAGTDFVIQQSASGIFTITVA